jgi:hypothetical protein
LRHPQRTARVLDSDQPPWSVQRVLPTGNAPCPVGDGTYVLDGLLREYDDGRAAFELWKAAIAAGGPDNITLAVVRIADR